MEASTVDPAMKLMEARMPMTETTRLRKPMMRVAVFREAHSRSSRAQQFGSFGRATILVKNILGYWGLQTIVCTTERVLKNRWVYTSFDSGKTLFVVDMWMWLFWHVKYTSFSGGWWLTV